MTLESSSAKNSHLLWQTGVLMELRSKVYMPWKEKQFNTPNVAHDNPKEQQFQASLMLGFADKSTMDKFFEGDAVKKLSERLAVFCSAFTPLKSSRHGPT